MLGRIMLGILLAFATAAPTFAATDDKDLFVELLEEFLKTMPADEAEAIGPQLFILIDEFDGTSQIPPTPGGGTMTDAEGSAVPNNDKSSPALSAGGAPAAMQFAAGETSSGRLTVEPLGAIACAGSPAVSVGEPVRLTGNGFAANAAVRIELLCCNGVISDLGPATADSSGDLDTTVAIPSVLAVPAISLFEADGPSPSGHIALRATVLIGNQSVDTDGDGFSDFCDNCPAASNPGQEDDDADGIGNACDDCLDDPLNNVDGDQYCDDEDPCPLDPDNDMMDQEDGYCADVDNCPTVFNPSQADSDGNGIGDACQLGATCSDGFDNDRDGFTDFPADKGCEDAEDNTETSAFLPCDDGIDNDADGLVDFRLNRTGDPGCGWDTASPLPENPACDDGVDNNGDGFIDWDGDLGFASPDEDCQGFGFGTSEVVPEPTLSSCIAAGVLAIALGGRRGCSTRYT